MSRAAALAAVLLLPLAAAPARADAIDGHWCRAAKHFSIAGPEIVTPAGTRMQGDYDRHGFRYVVPPNEPGAGVKIEMVLLGDDELQLSRGASGGGNAPETWRRCAAPTS
jgi:hypothetical protein